ncbi:hypothetical protein NE237_032463 [Protea cynaroides]|uniref:Serine/arginine repetitive matrix protein 1-like n=1 Tax=Protea cynaroides TaxID=273540 RepID=A0A9Q0L3J1_9MAGN|nr:hypothetical protein NE237_032463 [Protea cynaroides]
MGCCVSKNKVPGQQAEASYLKEAAGDSKSHLTLPSLSEEETVKEVLSETPTPKPSFRNVETQKIPKPSIPKIEKEKKPSPPPTPLPLPSFPKKIEEEVAKRAKPSPDPSQVVEEISEVSDMCSLSETVSTTTIGERYGVEDGEVRQRVDRSPAKIPRKRLVSGELPARTERGGKSSPARRLDPSPGRRNDNNATKPSQIHHQSTRDTNGGYIRRRQIPSCSSGGVRRDLGESSGRRSRSPATRPALERSPSSKAVRSPARIPTLGQDNGERSEEAKEEGNFPTNESLENPLVSMECFIFL